MEQEKENENILALFLDGNWRLAELHLRKSVDVNIRDKSGRTLLHIVCEHGNIEIASLLMEKGANLEAKYNFGRTALHVAAESGREHVLEFLLKVGSDIEAKDNVGRTVLQRVSYKGYLPLAIKLLDAGANCSAQDETGSFPLHSACEKGHTNIAALLLARGSIIDCRDNFGRSPLHLACLYDHLDTVTWLCEQGASLNIKDIDGRTPLHVASFKDHIEVASYLIEAGADMECQSNDGRTPLHCAAVKGNTETTYLLLEKGATTECKDLKGMTPLLCACDVGQLEAASILLDKGAFIEACDSNGKTAIQKACEKRMWRVTSYLRDRGALLCPEFNYVDAALSHAHYSVDKRSEPSQLVVLNAFELFLRACGAGDVAAVQVGLEVVDSVNRLGYDGLAGIHIACIHGRADVCALLLDQGADIEFRTGVADSRTPLHCAAENGHVDVVYTLLNRTADVDAITLTGKTALFMVCDWDSNSEKDVGCRVENGKENCYNRHVELACALLEFGANASIIPAKGKRGNVCEIADVDGNLILHRALMQCAYLCSFDDSYFVNIILLLLKAFPQGARVRNKVSQLPLNIALENDASIDIVGPLIEATKVRKSEMSSICRSALGSSWCNIDSLHFLLYALQEKSYLPTQNIHICGDTNAGKSTLRHALCYLLGVGGSKRPKKASSASKSNQLPPASMPDSESSTSFASELEPVGGSLSWLTISPTRKVRAVDPVLGKSVGVSSTLVGDEKALLYVHDLAGRKYFHPLHNFFLAKPNSIFVLVLNPWDPVSKAPLMDDQCLNSFKHWLHRINAVAEPTPEDAPTASLIVVVNVVDGMETEKAKLKRLKEVIIGEHQKWIKLSHLSWSPFDTTRQINNLPTHGNQVSQRRPLQHSGYMLRQSEVQKSWRKRFYVLHLGVLRYFDSNPFEKLQSNGEQSATSPSLIHFQPKPAGEMFLLDYCIEVVSNSRFLLRNRFRKCRELLLEVEDPNDRRAWIEALESHLQYLRKQYRVQMYSDPQCLNVSLTSDASIVTNQIHEVMKYSMLRPESLSRCAEISANELVFGDLQSGHSSTSGSKLGHATMPKASFSKVPAAIVEARHIKPVMTLDSFKQDLIVPCLKQLRSESSRIDDCVFAWLSAVTARQLVEKGYVHIVHAEEGDKADGFVVTDLNWLLHDTIGNLLREMFDKEGMAPMPILTTPQLNHMLDNVAKQFKGDENILPQLFASLGFCVPMSDIIGPYIPQREELMINGSSFGMLIFPTFVDLPGSKDSITPLPCPSPSEVETNSRYPQKYYRRLVRRFALVNSLEEFPVGYFPSLFASIAELEHNTKDIVITRDSLVIQRCYSMCGFVGNIVQIIVNVDVDSNRDSDDLSLSGGEGDRLNDKASADSSVKTANSFTVTVCTLMMHSPTGRTYAARRMQSITDLIKYKFSKAKAASSPASSSTISPATAAVLSTFDKSVVYDLSFSKRGYDDDRNEASLKSSRPSRQFMRLVVSWIQNVEVTEYCVHPHDYSLARRCIDASRDLRAILNSDSTLTKDMQQERDECLLMLFGTNEAGSAAVDATAQSQWKDAGDEAYLDSDPVLPDSILDEDVFNDILEELN